MPNTPVPTAATGLPAIRTPIAAIMRRAHDDARAASPRAPYADPLRLALRGAIIGADAIDAAPNAGRARTLSMIEEDIEASTRALERPGKIIARLTSAEARR